MDDNELARIAFEAYGRDTGGKTWDGKEIPPWSAIPEKVKHAWRAAIAAVMNHVALETPATQLPLRNLNEPPCYCSSLGPCNIHAPDKE